jgi:hypothetical protein
VLAELLPSIQGDHIGRDAAYVRELVETSLKVCSDGTGTGDLKLLNAALRELRYAFKVFAPYRGVRKVSCFGSARDAGVGARVQDREGVLAAHRRPRLHGRHRRRRRHHEGVPGRCRP